MPRPSKQQENMDSPLSELTQTESSSELSSIEPQSELKNKPSSILPTSSGAFSLSPTAEKWVRGKVTAAFPKNLSLEEWGQTVAFLREGHKQVTWKVVIALCYGEDTFGEQYTSLLDAAGWDWSNETKQSYISTGKAVIGKCWVPDLSLSYHRLVAPIWTHTSDGHLCADSVKECLLRGWLKKGTSLHDAKLEVDAFMAANGWETSHMRTKRIAKAEKLAALEPAPDAPEPQTIDLFEGAFADEEAAPAPVSGTPVSATDDEPSIIDLGVGEVSEPVYEGEDAEVEVEEEEGSLPGSPGVPVETIKGKKGEEGRIGFSVMRSSYDKLFPILEHLQRAGLTIATPQGVVEYLIDKYGQDNELNLE